MYGFQRNNLHEHASTKLSSDGFAQLSFQKVETLVEQPSASITSNQRSALH